MKATFIPSPTEIIQPVKIIFNATATETRIAITEDNRARRLCQVPDKEHTWAIFISAELESYAEFVPHSLMSVCDRMRSSFSDVGSHWRFILRMMVMAWNFLMMTMTGDIPETSILIKQQNNRRPRVGAAISRDGSNRTKISSGRKNNCTGAKEPTGNKGVRVTSEIYCPKISCTITLSAVQSVFQTVRFS